MAAMTEAQFLRLIELQNATIEAQGRTIVVLQDLLVRDTGRTVGALSALRSEVRKTREALMAKLDDLEREVEQNEDVQRSAVTLLHHLSQQIKDAGTDPAKLAALTARLDTNSAALAAAIVANTPAGPDAGEPQPA